MFLIHKISNNVALSLTGSGDTCLWTVSHSRSVTGNGSSNQQHLLESASAFTTALSARHSCTAPPASTPPAAGPFPAASFSSEPATTTHSAFQPTPPTPQSPPRCTRQHRHGPAATNTSGHSVGKPFLLSALSMSSMSRIEGEKERSTHKFFCCWICDVAFYQCFVIVFGGRYICTDKTQIKRKIFTVLVKCWATTKCQNSFSVSYYRFSKSLEWWQWHQTWCSKISRRCLFGLRSGHQEGHKFTSYSHHWLRLFALWIERESFRKWPLLLG